MSGAGAGGTDPVVPGSRPDLGSAAAPTVGPGDHARGDGPEAIVYFDLACPMCASAWRQIAAQPLRLCVRHFPIAGRRPRSPALHAATEAAALQSEAAFWSLWDSLLADRSHTDDPHLWQRVRELQLDLERFERDRRAPEVTARVRRDFHSGVRAGVTATPTAFVGGAAVTGDPVAALVDLAAAGRSTGGAPPHL